MIRGGIIRNPDDSWWLKLKRAEKHLTELKDYTASFSDTRPYDTELRVEREPERTHYIVRAYLRDPPDYTPSIIIGDCIHDIRSALDHIVAELTEPVELRERSSFPIYEKNIRQPGFKAQREAFRTATEGLPDHALAFVEQVQPYHRGEDAPLDPLAILHRLSNADKHRELIVTSRALLEPATGLTSDESVSVLVQHRIGLAFENGAEIAHFSVAGEADPELRVHSHGAMSIAIKWGPDHGVDLVLPDALESIIKYVSGVVVLTLDTFVPS